MVGFDDNLGLVCLIFSITHGSTLELPFHLAEMILLMGNHNTVFTVELQWLER